MCSPLKPSARVFPSSSADKEKNELSNSIRLFWLWYFLLIFVNSKLQTRNFLFFLHSLGQRKLFHFNNNIDNFIEEWTNSQELGLPEQRETLLCIRSEQKIEKEKSSKSLFLLAGMAILPIVEKEFTNKYSINRQFLLLTMVLGSPQSILENIIEGKEFQLNKSIGVVLVRRERRS